MQNWKLTEIPEGKYVGMFGSTKNVPIQQHCWSVGRKIKVIWYNKGLQGDINSVVEFWVLGMSIFVGKGKFFSEDIRQGQASGMDWTLHTDLWKSETSRDIKK